MLVLLHCPEFGWQQKKSLEISTHFITVLLHKAEPCSGLQLLHKMSPEKITLHTKIKWKMPPTSSGRSWQTPQLNNNTFHPWQPLLLQPLLFLPLLWMRKWQSSWPGWQTKWRWQRCSTQEAQYFNAHWKGEDAPHQGRSNVTACLCISGSLADENVYSGSMNQWWGEILIHFHLKFPFKFSICGCLAGWLFEAAWCHEVWGQKTLLLFDF